MLRQNRALRGQALGPFPRLLEAVTTDWAMLLFLSLADSDKDAPNENYARELMELFTLGDGYTERDVREAASPACSRCRWGSGSPRWTPTSTSTPTTTSRPSWRRGWPV